MNDLVSQFKSVLLMNLDILKFVLEVLNPLLTIQKENLLPLKVQLDFHHLPLQASPVCN